MLFRLVRPVKRTDSSHSQFAQRIPVDVRDRAVGRTLIIPQGAGTVRVTITARTEAIRFSLRTRDPSEAKARQAQACAYLETTWAALRTDRPVSLSHRQAVALSGHLYAAWADGGADRTIAVTHTPNGWVRDRCTPDEERAAFKDQVKKLDASDPADLEPTLGPIIDRLLIARSIAPVTAETRAVLLGEFAKALRDAFASRKRNAKGDFSPDPKATRFPTWEPPGTTPPKAAPPVVTKTSLTGLVDGWWEERKAAGLSPSTHESYRNTMAAFVAFLKHDDASRVKVEDVIAFKDHRLRSINPRSGRPIAAKTVKDSDLAGLRAVFGWAVDNRRLVANPAQTVKLKLGKARKIRERSFTDAEAHAILKAARAHKRGGRELRETAAAKRWVPWLAAYSGARVGELGQLRKEDLRREGTHWVIRITPEAGPVKTNEARDVVLHSHLVEQGFPEFVAKARPGHLFLRLGESVTVAGPLQALKNRLAEFARTIVTDPNVAPNHGWRHRFASLGREVDMGDRVMNAIQGHAPKTAGDRYGEVNVRARAAAIEKLPRIEVSDT